MCLVQRRRDGRPEAIDSKLVRLTYTPRLPMRTECNDGNLRVPPALARNLWDCSPNAPSRPAPHVPGVSPHEFGPNRRSEPTQSRALKTVEMVKFVLGGFVGRNPVLFD